jgi:hypothetical protein
MRSRILAIAAGVVTAVIIALAVPALRGGGGENSLARAAENLQGQNMRIDFVAGVTQGKKDSAVSAAGVVSADGSRGRLTMHAEVQGTKVTVRHLRVGGQVHVASNQLEKALPPGKRWVHAASAADTPTTMSMPEFANFLRGAGDVQRKGETVDGRGRPQRLIITVDAGASGSATLSMDIFEYGVKADFHPPPPDQVVEASELKTG